MNHFHTLTSHKHASIFMRRPCKEYVEGLFVAPPTKTHHSRWLVIRYSQTDLKWPLRSVNFISLVTCFGLQEEEPQTAHLLFFIWASHIAASVLTGHWTPTQSINQSISRWHSRLNGWLNDCMTDLLCVGGAYPINSVQNISISIYNSAIHDSNGMVQMEYLLLIMRLMRLFASMPRIHRYQSMVDVPSFTMKIVSGLAKIHVYVTERYADLNILL